MNPSRDLENSLRSSPKPAGPVSSELHARIMAGVRMTDPLPARRGPRPEGATALAVLALAAGLLVLLRTESPSGPILDEFAAALPSLESVLSLMPGPVPEPAVPLSREADALKNDLASAGSYLLACVGGDH